MYFFTDESFTTGAAVCFNLKQKKKLNCYIDGNYQLVSTGVTSLAITPLLGGFFVYRRQADSEFEDLNEPHISFMTPPQDSSMSIFF